MNACSFVTLPTLLVPVTESLTTQALHFPLLLSYRILYTAVSFGAALGSDDSAEDKGFTRV